MSNASKLDKEIVEEFIGDWEELSYQAQIIKVRYVHTDIQSLNPDAFADALPDGADIEKDAKVRLGQYFFRPPNIILNNWKLSGFIDVGNGGVGDRHIDIFWGVWTLWFNLKTNRYQARFLDAYGRDKADKSVLKIVAAAEVFG